MAGTLFVVATPIGNLEDLTFRALRTLREVDLIAAEDTRRTSKLLAHYEVRKPVISLREHNEVRETPRLLARLEQGSSVALVSDAGTPGIADPGARLVQAARERGLSVVPVPGPNAIAAALSVSGQDVDQYVFFGFPPSSGTARKKWFEEVAREPRVAVCFEAPHRVRRTLSELVCLVKRPIVVARELTKAHEQLVNIHNNGDIDGLRYIGEFVLILGSLGDPTRQTVDDTELNYVYGYLTNDIPVEHDLAIELTAARFQVPASRVRKAVKKARIETKKQQTSLP